MNMIGVSTALATLALRLTVPVSAQEFATKRELAEVEGTYRSSAPEPWYGGYGSREFVFRDGTWSLVFLHALDPDMTLRTFQFRTGGSYEIKSPSPAVQGAYHSVFHEDWKHLTLLTQDQGIVEAMGLADCNLPFNIETDISASGCAAWKPVADCSEDHDLLAGVGSSLHFGVRPADNDMCTADKVPTELLPAVLKFSSPHQE